MQSKLDMIYKSIAELTEDDLFEAEHEINNRLKFFRAH